MQKAFFAILAASMIVSCTKENQTPNEEECKVIHEDSTNDTLVSSSYLAAYPGSQWSYSSGHQITCHNTEINIYSLMTEFMGCQHIQKKQIIAPENIVLGKIDSIYEIITDEVEFTTRYVPIIGFEMGEFYHHVEYNMTEEPKNIKTYERSVIGIYDSLEIGGNMYYDLIKVKHLVNIAAPGINSMNDVKYYTSANNVGLVRYQYPLESLDIKLSGYYINE